MKKLIILLLLIPLVSFGQLTYEVDWETVAKIREEGFQRSEIANTLSYMTDVLGARLTNSEDMRRAQDWAINPSWIMELVGTMNIFLFIS